MDEKLRFLPGEFRYYPKAELITLRLMTPYVAPGLLGAVFGHFQVALANEWFIGNEQIGTALLLIAVVLPCDLSRLG